MSDQDRSEDERRLDLPHGRSLTVRRGGDAGGMEICSPDGTVELSIRLTASGPVVSVRAESLRIDAAGDVNLRCDAFNLETAGDIGLVAGGDLSVSGAGEIRTKSDGQTFIDGDYVNVNCLERDGYHDGPDAKPPLAEPPES